MAVTGFTEQVGGDIVLADKTEPSFSSAGFCFLIQGSLQS
jgi:hypothetical protein